MANNILEIIKALSMDSGTVTSSSAPGTSGLVDATKAWPIDKLTGKIVRIISGFGVGQRARIVSNNSNVLYVSPTWTLGLTQTSIYIIYDPEIVSEISSIFNNVGYEGATSLADKLTLARAILLDEITPARMAELDPLGLPADIAAIVNSMSGLCLHGTVTAVPGANQFTIPTLVGMGAGKFSDLTNPYNAFVQRDAGGAGAAPQGEINQITAYDNVTGTFTTIAFTAAVAVGDEILIMHPSLAGVAALAAAIVALQADVGDASTSILGSLYDIIGNPAQTIVSMIGYEGATSLANKLTAARAALLDGITALRMAELDPAGLPADIAAVAAAIAVLNDLAQADILSDATPFPGANIDATISSRAPSATALSTATWTAALAAALANYTAARAGYLDELSAANIPTDIDGLTTRLGRTVFYKDQWCATPIAALAIPAVAADLTLSDVVFPAGFLPAGVVTQSVYLMIKWRKQVDSSGAPNAINGVGKSWRIKKNGGVWGADDVEGIVLADNQMATGASATEGGDMIIGEDDISGEVDDVDNETYNVRGDQTNRADAPVVDGACLTLYDVYTGLRVYYTLS